MLSKRNKKSTNNIDVFSGIWSKEESKEIEDIIKKGAENIDNEW